VRGDLAAGLEARVEPDPGVEQVELAARRTSNGQRPLCGCQSAAGSSAYSRTSIAWPYGLADRREGSRRSATELQLDQVDAVHELGDRVLDLEPGVHLQEPERLVAGVDEELDGAGADVVDRAGGRCAAVVQSRSASRARPGAGASSTTFWWRAGASSPARRAPDVRAVADDLHLDVAAALDVRLDEHRAVAERGLGLGRGLDLAGRSASVARSACRARRRPRTP
jgi:hypothetical protein